LLPTFRDIGSIFNGQTAPEESREHSSSAAGTSVTLEDGTDSLSRNVVN